MSSASHLQPRLAAYLLQFEEWVKIKKDFEGTKTTKVAKLKSLPETISEIGRAIQPTESLILQLAHYWKKNLEQLSEEILIGQISETVERLGAVTQRLSQLVRFLKLKKSGTKSSNVVFSPKEQSKFRSTLRFISRTLEAMKGN